MVRRTLEEFKRKKYSKMNIEERRNFWIKLVSDKLSISLEEAKRIIHSNNSLPKWSIINNDGNQVELKLEYHLTLPSSYKKLYPRFHANTILLSKLSESYRGPRGPRPVYVTLENIARISVDGPFQLSYWRKSLGRNINIPQFLIESELTASMPDLAPNGVEFTFNDIRRGVYIPPLIDKRTIRALGIIYASGYVTPERNMLKITGAPRYREFLKNVAIRRIEEAFNILQDNIYEYSQTSHFSNNKYNYLRLSYDSRALSTYLLNEFNFPGSELEKREKGISEKIKNNANVNEFIKFYLASNSTFSISKEKGAFSMTVHDVSKPLLEDMREMLLNVVKKPSIHVSQNPTANSSILGISTLPTLELYFSGFLNENKEIKRRVKEYLKEYGIGKRAFNHLYKIFGNKIDPYERVYDK